MPLLEDHTASFIVRVWRETGEADRASQEWRGSIEHVQSGQRMFFRELMAIAKFMQGPLAEIGIDARPRFWESMVPTLDFDAADEPTQTVPAAPSKKSARQRPKE